jgi:hypothetical protein
VDVCDRVDTDRFFEHAIRQDKRKPANQATADAEFGSNARIHWADGRKSDDQLHRALDRRNKA